MKQEQLYTLAEVAVIFRSKNVQVINRLRRQGRIKSIPFGGRFLVKESEIKYLMKNGLRPITKEWLEKAKLSQRQQRAKRKAREAAAAAGGFPAPRKGAKA